MVLAAPCLLCFFTFLVFFWPAGCNAGLPGSMQKVTLSGKVLCEGKPMAGVNVSLMDSDAPFADDQYQKGTTGSDGKFFLQGQEREINGLEPYIRIEHACYRKKEWKECILETRKNFPENIKDSRSELRRQKRVAIDRPAPTYPRTKSDSVPKNENLSYQD